MSGLVAIAELDRSRPPAHATRDMVAAWYERKSVVLNDIAATSAGAEQRELTACAERAQAHACALRER